MKEFDLESGANEFVDQKMREVEISRVEAEQMPGMGGMMTYGEAYQNYLGETAIKIGKETEEPFKDILEFKEDYLRSQRGQSRDNIRPFKGGSGEGSGRIAA